MHEARTRAKDHDLRNDGVHPMVGCARVHRDGAAHGAGNAHCELQPRQAFVERFGHNALQHRARTHMHPPRLVDGEATKVAAKHEDGALIALVAHEHVGPAAHDDPRHAFLAQYLDRLTNIGIIVAGHEQCRRATDAVARMAAHTLVGSDGAVQTPLETFLCFEKTHGTPPPRLDDDTTNNPS